MDAIGCSVVCSNHEHTQAEILATQKINRNSKDALVLDAGATIYVWCVGQASAAERNAANIFADD